MANHRQAMAQILHRPLMDHLAHDVGRSARRAIIALQAIRRFGFPAILQVDQRSSYIAMLDARDVAGLATLLATNRSQPRELPKR